MREAFYHSFYRTSLTHGSHINVLLSPISSATFTIFFPCHFVRLSIAQSLDAASDVVPHPSPQNFFEKLFFHQHTIRKPSTGNSRTASRGNWQANLCHDLFEVAPNHAAIFRCICAQKISRMKRRHQLDSPPVLPLPAQFSHGKT
jgi:hypothetical protein